ncbi:probable peptidyl-tRNA hydrolase 2 [Rhopilema esculentum]|uniref:probable peptidyl-tRNA hydrolase 2 n=1 Tax=Rhopilema esculentum TaxID=499914 RepID=UPI0031D7C2D3
MSETLSPRLEPSWLVWRNLVPFVRNPCFLLETRRRRGSNKNNNSNKAIAFLYKMADNLGPLSHARSTHYTEWQPTAELMQPLIEMGVSENAAKRGLYYTGGVSVDAAASWVFENMNDPEIHSPFKVELDIPPPSDESGQSDPLKMVFIVNNSLKMGVGKIAAQVAHAGLAVHKKLLLGETKLRHMEEEWEEMGCTKIVVKAESASELMEMERKAKGLHLPCYLVVDAGRTQVHPSSVTVLGIFGKAEDVNKVTGHLALL